MTVTTQQIGTERVLRIDLNADDAFLFTGIVTAVVLEQGRFDRQRIANPEAFVPTVDLISKQEKQFAWDLLAKTIASRNDL